METRQAKDHGGLGEITDLFAPVTIPAVRRRRAGATAPVARAVIFDTEVAPVGRRVASPSRLVISSSGVPAYWPEIRLADVNRILLVKLDHIGDWVLFTPFLANLKRNAPHAVIDALVLGPVAALANAAPQLDRVLAVMPGQGRRMTLRARDETEAAIFHHHYTTGAYDLALVPRWDADFDGGGRIASGSGAQCVVGFSESCTRRKRVLNRDNDRFYTHLIDDRRHVHETEHNLAMLEAMNATIVTRKAAIATTPAEQDAARDFLHHAFAGARSPLLAVAPFATEAKRTLPINATAALVHRVTRSFNCRVVVVGSPDDALPAARLARLIGGGARSAAGRLGLGEAAALIARCQAAIAVDSGPAHIAAATRTPVAVLSCHPRTGSPSHANAPERFGPWGEASRVLVLRPDEARAPCRACCCAPEPHCILGIDAAAIGPLHDFIGNALATREGPRAVSTAADSIS